MKERDFLFEHQLSSAFARAEMTPSARVWERIEADLDKKDSGRMRRSFFVWQMVAAASLVFAASVMIFNFIGNRSAQPIVSSSEKETLQEESIAQTKEEGILENKSEEPIVEVQNAQKTEDSSTSLAFSISKEKDEAAVTSSSQETLLASRHEISNSEIANNQLDKIGSVKMKRAWLPKPDIHKVALPIVVKEEPFSKNVSSPLWAGINVAGGASSAETSAFTPLSRLESKDVSFSEVTSPDLQQVRNTSKTGFGYSLGFAIGKNLTRRVYVQSGLQYLVQSTEGTTNAYYRNPDNQSEEPIFVFNSDKPLSDDSGNPLRQIEFYPQDKTVTSSLEYFSIPLQVGYLVVDRKLDWGFTAGLSTDFFVRNVVSDKSGDVEGYVTKGRDSDSPFRPVNLSAIFSTEINYNITENYSISVEPRFSTGLTSVTKEEENVEDRKLQSLSVGVKLRYIF